MTLKLFSHSKMKYELTDFLYSGGARQFTSYFNVSRHFPLLGETEKYGICVQHALTERNKLLVSSITTNLFTCFQATRAYKEKNPLSYYHLDEKWYLYVNVKQRKGGVSSKKHATLRTKLELDLHMQISAFGWTVTA